MVPESLRVLQHSIGSCMENVHDFMGLEGAIAPAAYPGPKLAQQTNCVTTGGYRALQKQLYPRRPPNFRLYIERSAALPLNPPHTAGTSISRLASGNSGELTGTWAGTAAGTTA